MKPLMITMVLALTSPVMAQSFQPEAAALRYCQLRRAGIESDDAMRAALTEYYDRNRQSPMVKYKGGEYTSDQLAFADLIADCV